MALRIWLSLALSVATPLVGGCSFPDVEYETTEPDPPDGGTSCPSIADCDGDSCGDDARGAHAQCADECGNNPPCNDECDAQLDVDLDACVDDCVTCAEAMDCASAESRCSQLVGGP